MPDYEVILQNDIDPLGRMGDVVKVSQGYARNFLLPRKLAVIADTESRKRIDKLRAKRAAEDAKRLEEVKSLAARIATLEVQIEAATSESGQLYGSVGAREIITALEAKGVQLQERDIRLTHPIKEVGVFPVKIHLRGDISTEVKVFVTEVKKSS